MTPAGGDDRVRPDAEEHTGAHTGGGPPRRLGIAGLGVISRFYLAAAERLPEWEVTAVCDLREEALAPYRGRVVRHTDHRELLASGHLDALVVAVPNHAHAEVCADALRAGVPVCVEKPLALDPADGRRLAALSREHGVPSSRRSTAATTTGSSTSSAGCPAGGAGAGGVRTGAVPGADRGAHRRGHLVPGPGPLRRRLRRGQRAQRLRPRAAGPRRAASEVVAAEVVRDAAGTDRRAVVELAGPDGRGRGGWSWTGRTPGR